MTSGAQGSVAIVVLGHAGSFHLSDLLAMVYVAVRFLVENQLHPRFPSGNATCRGGHVSSTKRKGNTMWKRMNNARKAAQSAVASTDRQLGKVSRDRGHARHAHLVHRGIDHRDLDFGVESLESRLLLAGNINAVVTVGGDLRVNGDSASNDVVIHATGTAGELYLEGRNGTTVNGQSSITLNGISDDIRVRLRGGDDQILLTGALDDGSTASAINFVDDVIVNSGGGDDIVYIDGVVDAGHISVVTGAGDDAVGFFLTESESLYTATGGGNDVVGFTGANVVERWTRVVTGGGNDNVIVAGDSSGFLSSRFGGVFTVGLGGGSDMLAFDGGRFEGGSIVNGGPGFDTVQTSDPIHDHPPIFIGVNVTGQDVISVYAQALSNQAIDGLRLWATDGIGQFFV